ncbi:MAG: hypothetical protein RIR46_633 [Actinomycetota bacterium]|jgi:hypothetical protein
MRAALKKWVTTEETFGEKVDGIEFRVFNERTIRAAAGLLFLFGFTGWMLALTTGNYMPMRAFGVAFMFDMILRLFVTTKWVPSLLIASWIVRPQRPEWVDAAPKKFAWWLGLIMVMSSCYAMGLFAMTGWLPLTLCAICISLLFVESAFGICVGCELARRFSKNKPRLCPGDVCNYTPEKVKKNDR